MQVLVRSRAQLDDTALSRLGAFVASVNDDPAQHIGYVDGGPADITRSLAELDSHGQLAVLGDLARPTALLAAEWDEGLGRTWLFGPWAPAQDWDDVADRLYAALRPRIPDTVGEHELFGDAGHARLATFAARHGFRRHDEHAILTFDRARLPSVPPTALPTLEPSQHAAFAVLHERAFPRTHTSPADIIAGRRRHRPPLVVVDGDRLLGYLAWTSEPESGRAQVEYLAVDPTARGRGVGTRLLRAVLHAALADPRTGAVDLVVDDHNETAWRVYRRAGFTLLRAMRSYRRPGPAG